VIDVVLPNNRAFGEILARMPDADRELVLSRSRDRSRALANEIWRVWRLNMVEPYELEATRWSQLVLEFGGHEAEMGGDLLIGAAS